VHPADHPRSAGGAALGARLRRASAAIDADAARIYAALGIDFEQRWFGVLDALAREDALTVSELAAALGVSHAAVSQVRHALEQRRLILSATDPADARRRKLMLSADGSRLVERLAPLWAAFAEAAAELDRDAGGIVQSLDELEAAMARKSLYDRILPRVPGLAHSAGGPSES